VGLFTSTGKQLLLKPLCLHPVRTGKNRREMILRTICRETSEERRKKQKMQSGRNPEEKGIEQYPHRVIKMTKRKVGEINPNREEGRGRFRNNNITNEEDLTGNRRIRAGVGGRRFYQGNKKRKTERSLKSPHRRVRGGEANITYQGKAGGEGMETVCLELAGKGGNFSITPKETGNSNTTREE